MRYLMILSALIVGTGLAGASFAQSSAEVNVDYPGGDYRSFDVANDPNHCRAQCDRDSACRAYTFVRPGVQRPGAVCYLKRTVPTRVANAPCCLSGVKRWTGDNDGLDDAWEMANSGRYPGLSPSLPNLIFVPVRVSASQSQDTLRSIVAKLERFYESQIGLDFIVVWGAPPLPGNFADLPEKEQYNSVVRTELQGKAFAIAIAGDDDLGGQTLMYRLWGGIQGGWRTIAHELGHMLGLEHAPIGKAASPFYTSIMNYDYTFGFNGNADQIRFSSGQFSALNLDERNLTETLPFPPNSLNFLSTDPYNFRIFPGGENATRIDFNRNGSAGEVRRLVNLRADINDGYAVSPKGSVYADHTAGGFALVSINDRLWSIYAKASRPTTWTDEISLSPATPGPLYVQRLPRDATSNDLGAAYPLLVPLVASDISAVEFGGLVYVAYRTAQNSWGVVRLEARDRTWLTQRDTFVAPGTNTQHPVLAVRRLHTTGTKELRVFLWDERTKRVASRQINIAAGGVMTVGPESEVVIGFRDAARAMTSNSMISVAGGPWSQLWLTTTESGAGYTSRLRLHAIAPTAAPVVERWASNPASMRWVGGEGEINQTDARPAMVFEEWASAGSVGVLYLHFKVPGSPATFYVTRYVQTAALGYESWRTRPMVNEWTLSRSPPAVALYQNEIAWAWRVPDTWPNDPRPVVGEGRPGTVRNTIQVFLEASGINQKGLSDQDDVWHILQTGLREAIARWR